MQVQGPLSAKTLEKLVGPAIYDLKYYWLGEFKIGDNPVVISRTGWTAVPGFEVNVLEHGAGGAELWNAVASAGEEFEIRPIAPCEARRIEAGIFNYGSDMTLDDTPFHIMGMERLVEPQEQDYLGKDALEALRDDRCRPQTGGGVPGMRPAARRVLRGLAGVLQRQAGGSSHRRRLVAGAGEEHRLHVGPDRPLHAGDSGRCPHRGWRRAHRGGGVDPLRRSTEKGTGTETERVTTTAHSRRLHGVIIVLTAVSFLIAFAPAPAWAQIPNLSAFVNNPTPNPVPAGATATTTAVFSLGADSGPITVGIQLLGPAGFGALRLDAAGSSPELINCVETQTQVTCEWPNGLAVESPQTLAVFIDVDIAAPPTGANLAAIASSATVPVEVYGTAFIGAIPPLGTTTMSGTVITEGGAPVAQACIYLLSSPQFVFPTVADGAGAWQLTGLPDSYSFVVGVIPPFDIGFGPCASNGPPPVPAPGELQPVFFEDIWVDLADPNLTGGLMDPYVFAVNAGATVFTGSNGGIETCLTNAPAAADPRPPCVAAVTTTTSTSTTVGIGPTSTILAETLPVTGPPTPMSPVVATVLILVGLGLLALANWGRRSD